MRKVSLEPSTCTRLRRRFQAAFAAPRTASKLLSSHLGVDVALGGLDVDEREPDLHLDGLVCRRRSQGGSREPTRTAPRGLGTRRGRRAARVEQNLLKGLRKTHYGTDAERAGLLVSQEEADRRMDLLVAMTGDRPVVLPVDAPADRAPERMAEVDHDLRGPGRREAIPV